MTLPATPKPLWYNRAVTRCNELRHVACHRIVASTVIPEHSLPAWELALVVKGSISMSLRGQELNITGGSCAIIPPHTRFGSGSGENRGLVYWIGVVPKLDPPEYEPLLSVAEQVQLEKRLAAVAGRPLTFPPELHAAAQHLFLLCHQHCPSALLVRGAALSFIGLVEQLGDQRDTSPATATLLAPALALVAERVEGDIYLRDLMAACGLSRTAFNAAFRRGTGYSPRDYINEAKIARARELLAEDNASVAAVSRRLGFSSGQYFSTVFRRLTGQTPTAYQLRQRSGRG